MQYTFSRICRWVSLCWYVYPFLPIWVRIIRWSTTGHPRIYQTDMSLYSNRYLFVRSKIGGQKWQHIFCARPCNFSLPGWRHGSPGNQAHLHRRRHAHSLFHTPTGSAHRSVHGLFGFTKRRSDWLKCVRLWRANPIVTYPNKHGVYPAVANMTSVANVTQTKGVSSSGDCCIVGIFKKQGIPWICRGRGQSYAHRHGTWNSLTLA